MKSTKNILLACTAIISTLAVSKVQASDWYAQESTRLQAQASSSSARNSTAPTASNSLVPRGFDFSAPRGDASSSRDLAPRTFDRSGFAAVSAEDIAGYETRVTDLERALEQSRIDAIQSRSTDAIAATRAGFEKTRAEREQATTMSRLRAERAALQAELEGTNARLLDLEARFEETTADAAALTREKAQLTERLAETLRNVEDLQRNLDQAETHIRRLDQNNVRLNAALESSKLEVRRLNLAFAGKVTALRETETELEGAVANIQDLNASNQRYQTALEDNAASMVRERSALENDRRADRTASARAHAQMDEQIAAARAETAREIATSRTTIQRLGAEKSAVEDQLTTTLLELEELRGSFARLSGEHADARGMLEGRGTRADRYNGGQFDSYEDGYDARAMLADGDNQGTLRARVAEMQPRDEVDASGVSGGRVRAGGHVVNFRSPLASFVSDDHSAGSETAGSLLNSGDSARSNATATFAARDQRAEDRRSDTTTTAANSSARQPAAAAARTGGAGRGALTADASQRG